MKPCPSSAELPKEGLRVLHVAAEVAPWIKVGGLGDVVGALLKEGAASGHEVRALVPSYGGLGQRLGWPSDPRPLSICLEDPTEGRLWEVPPEELGGARLLLLEHPVAFARTDVYWPDVDNAWRFLLLSRAALDYCQREQWWPDVIHCHDWMTGLIPAMLEGLPPTSPLKQAATVLTLHNLQHQGPTDASMLSYAGLDAAAIPHPASLFHHGRLNLLKAGLTRASKLVAVSPTYTQEIQTPAYGESLHEVVRERAADLVGILNGIDMETWNPTDDPYLPAGFSADDLSGKAVCKATLQAELGLAVRAEVPIFGVVARLVAQKGLDLLVEIAADLLTQQDWQFAVLGTGDPQIERHLTGLAAAFPGRFGVRIGFDVGLSHRIEAGSDFFVMPSRFEPCGLNQMYSLRYGTLPIVRATGGLADTVQPIQPGSGNGFRFEEPTAPALREAMLSAGSFWKGPVAELAAARRRAMLCDFSWRRSAQRYTDLYHAAVAAHRGHLPLPLGLAETGRLVVGA